MSDSLFDDFCESVWAELLVIGLGAVVVAGHGMGMYGDIKMTQD